MASFTIAILLFDNYTALDVVGPYEILSRIPDSKIYMVAEKPGLYKNDKGLQISADYGLNEIQNPDIFVIPGGFGIDPVLSNQAVLRWIKQAHITSKWTVSVCSGALLLAEAGILKNCRATTHRARKEQLAKYGVMIQNERYVREGKVITSAGVSAGIDMSLYLVSLLVSENFARAVQYGIEYDPKPPFDVSSPEKIHIKNIVFDLGGVLIDWNPRYLYRHVFSDPSEMEFFLENVCTSEWNLKQDAGYPLSEATKELQLQYPQYHKEIALYYGEWTKMLGGEICENTRLLKLLKIKYRVFALTNWSAETFPVAFERFPFLKEFEGIVVSGTEKVVKPDQKIYEILLNRYQLKAEESLFIDDNLNNLVAAKKMGFYTLHMKERICLSEELKKLGLF